MNFLPFFHPLVFLRNLKGEGKRKGWQRGFCLLFLLFILYSCCSSFLSYPRLCLSSYLDLRYDLLTDQVGTNFRLLFCSQSRFPCLIVFCFFYLGTLPSFSLTRMGSSAGISWTPLNSLLPWDCRALEQRWLSVSPFSIWGTWFNPLCT